jgi:hyperosmotically inducible protein
MIVETRRLAHTLLLAAGLCGCASQHHRSETASEEPATEVADSDVDETMDERATAGAEDDDVGSRRRVAETMDDTDDGTRDRDGDADEAAAADNTAMNERDRDGDTLTAGDQSNSASDLEITRRIRETVVEDDSLSFTAKNVKIITIGGRVTLRGPVNNEAERTTIEKKALAVAGAGQVVNQLEIK